MRGETSIFTNYRDGFCLVIPIHIHTYGATKIAIAAIIQFSPARLTAQNKMPLYTFIQSDPADSYACSFLHRSEQL